MAANFFGVTEFDAEMQFRDVAGLVGYKVNNHGEVWTRYIRGRKALSKKWRKMKATVGSTGYEQVNLQCNGCPKTFKVHRLIAVAFLGECPPGSEVCHNDGAPTNNYVGNLRYGTKKENSADRIGHGTDGRGRSRDSNRLNAEQVLEIRRLRLAGETQKTIAERFVTSLKNVRDICTRKTWRHIA